MNEKETIILTVVGEEEVRLDKYLADVVEDQSRASIQRLMEAGEVRLEGRVVSKNANAKPGDRVKLTILLQFLWVFSLRIYPWILSTRMKTSLLSTSRKGW